MRSSSFAKVKTVAFDSMCFIYHFEANPKYGPLVQKIFSLVATSRLSAFTSVISVAETLSESILPNKPEARVYYKERFLEMKNLKLVDVNLDIAEQAAVIRSNYKLKLGDAIQLATALKANAQIFITNDKQFRQVKEVRVMMLDNLL